MCSNTGRNGPSGGTSKLGQLLLQQIRFLDHIVDGKALSKQLLEAIETSSGSTKASLILVLPELLEDAQQEVEPLSASPCLALRVTR